MFTGYAIQEIRLLPMDDKIEFLTWKSVRDFLAAGLASQDWEYWYHERGINLKDTDAVVLFQYKASIVGYGVFRTRVKTGPYPEMVNGQLLTYHGYNKFYPNSVENIEPITASEFAQIVPKFRKFCQSMQKIDLSHLAEISKLLEYKQSIFIP